MQTFRADTSAWRSRIPLERLKAGVEPLVKYLNAQMCDGEGSADNMDHLYRAILELWEFDPSFAFERKPPAYLDKEIGSK